MNDAPRTDEHDLQDYLDGRLPAERRAAFESRLSRSPELRRAMESALEIREALGTGDEALSPGFYTRARARFEQSVGRSGPRWSIRLLSWETAGVAAAAALATALFVPWLMDEGVPEELGTARQVKAQDPGAPEKIVASAGDKDRSGTGLGQAEAPADLEPSVGGPLEAQVERARATSPTVEPETAQRRSVTKEKLEKAPRERDAGERDEAGGKGDWSPEPGALADQDSVSGGRLAKRPPTPAPKHAPRARSEGESHALDEEKSRETASSPRRDPQSGSSDDSFNLGERENEALESTARSVAGEDRTKRSAVGKVGAVAKFEDAPPAQTPLFSVELPAGLVAAGELLTVEDVDEWEVLLGSPHGRALSMLGPPAPDRRLVLVGAREDLECETLFLVQDGGTYRIDTGTVRKGSGVRTGCAFTLPRDNRPIVVGPPGRESRHR